jgi:hypothetical protein
LPYQITATAISIVFRGNSIDLKASGARRKQATDRIIASKIALRFASNGETLDRFIFWALP